MGKRPSVLCLVLLLIVGTAYAEPPLRVVFGNSPPMAWHDPEGRPRGFAVDVLTEAARREGISLRWQSAISIADNNQSLRNGTLDLIVTGFETPERRREFWISEPWWSSEILAVTRA